MCSFVGIKSPDPNLPQNSGKKPDISKGIFENGMWKFDSFKVSQTVRQLEIATSEIPEMPANCGLLQISVPSLSSQFGQSQCGVLARSGTKDEACPRVGTQELIWHLGLGNLVERLTGAVQWNDIVDIDIAERHDRVAHIVFLIGGEVESADHRMNFLNARSRLGLFDRVDHPAMTAGGQYDQPASFQIERGSDLMPELVRDDSLGPLVLRKPLGIAANAVVCTENLIRVADVMESPKLAE